MIDHDIDVSISSGDLVTQHTNRVSLRCGHLIYQVVDRNAQMNLAAAAAAGVLSADDMAVYRQGLGWISAMRARAAEVAADLSVDPEADIWPAAPDPVRDLASRF